MTKTDAKVLVKVLDDLERNLAILEELQEKYQDKYDNMSENAQMSDRGDEAQDTADTLDDAKFSLEDVIGIIEEMLP